MFDYVLLVLKNRRDELFAAQKGCVDRSGGISEELCVDILDFEGKIQEISSVIELLEGLSKDILEENDGI